MEKQSNEKWCGETNIDLGIPQGHLCHRLAMRSRESYLSFSGPWLHSFKWVGWSADLRSSLSQPPFQSAWELLLCRALRSRVVQVMKKELFQREKPESASQVGEAANWSHEAHHNPNNLRKGSPSDLKLKLNGKTEFLWSFVCRKVWNFLLGDITSNPSICQVLCWARGQQGRIDPTLC